MAPSRLGWVVLVATLAQAQGTWVRRAPSPGPRAANQRLVYDATRSRLLLFGGSDGQRGLLDTWEWDGTRWYSRSTTRAPRATGGLTLTFAFGRVLAFGGVLGNQFLDELWEWDGTDWAEVTPALSPPARSNHCLAFDAARGRVVLFGGLRIDGTVLGDTWEFDGLAWRQLAPATAPPPLQRATMAYDAARGEVVLFGGLTAGAAQRSETWAWNGTTWTQRGPAAGAPDQPLYASMTWDPVRRVVVLHGESPRVWTWDGTRWTGLVPRASSFKPRANPATAFFPPSGRVVVLGGFDGSDVLEELWEWDGAGFVEQSLGVSPTLRTGHGTAYSTTTQRTLLFGGANFGGQNLLDDTWAWGGLGWVQKRPSTRPPARREHAMAWDGARNRAVLFGGLGAPAVGMVQVPLSDTWEWDGAQWVARAGARPSARFGASLSFDSVRGELVLFGGEGPTGELNDTWVLGASGWQQRAVAGPPPARSNGAMAFDPARGVLVLFGGWRGGPLQDTWEWNGVTWLQRSPTLSPPPRSDHGMVYEPSSARILVHGGNQGAGAVLDELWAWDGTSWSQVLPTLNPPGHYAHQLTWDSARARVVLVPGAGADDLYRRDVWEYRATPSPQLNRPPVLAPIADLTAQAELPASFAVNATDPDADALAFYVLERPPLARFDPELRVFDWTPTAADVGDRVLRVVVTDGVDADWQDVRLSVRAGPRDGGLDAGPAQPNDAGVDAGARDSGIDGPQPDAGADLDAGAGLDAGVPDGGVPDGGVGAPQPQGCGCSTGPSGLGLLVIGTILRSARRRCRPERSGGSGGDHRA